MPTLATIVNQLPWLQVYVDGVLLPYHFGVKVDYGLDMDNSEAEFVVPYFVTQPAKHSFVQIILGANGSTATTRFTGHVWDYNYTNWPEEYTVYCKGMLFALQYAFPPTTAGIYLGEAPDEQIVSKILEIAGVPLAYRMNIQGTGKILGTTGQDLGNFGDFLGADLTQEFAADLNSIEDSSYTWPADRSGKSMIDDLDEVCLGYRTFEGPDGSIFRKQFSTIPTSVAKFSFYEGLNMYESSSRHETKPPADRVVIIGANGVATVLGDAEADEMGMSVDAVTSDWIESQLASSNLGLSTEAVANWRHNQYKWRFIAVDVNTYVDDLIAPGDTVYVENWRLRVNQNFYVMHVTVTVDDDGHFMQTLNCVSELGLGSFNSPVMTGGGFDGGFGGPGGIANPSPPSPPAVPTVPTVPVLAPPPNAATAVTPSFAIRMIDREKIVDGVTERYLYIVTCEDTSSSTSGTITTRAWLASGPQVGLITTGSGALFTCDFYSLIGSKIRLTVTDSGGRTGFIEKDISNGGGAPIRARKLYTAASLDAEAFDGDVWRIDAPSVGSVTKAANGPAWGFGARVGRSADELATGMLEVAPAGANTVDDIFIEPDVAELTVVAGLGDGSMAGSDDGGAVWGIRVGPDPPSPIRRIVHSRFTPGQIHAVTATGYYVSDNYGMGWRRIATGNYVDMALAPARNVFATSAGGMVAINGEGVITPFTFPAGAGLIISVTADIRLDRFYAIASDGTTYYTTTAGGVAMTQGVSLPTGSTAQIRGAYRDGTMWNVVYFAAGANGVWKTINGFQTANGYRQLRKASVGNARTGPWTMVGVGTLKVLTAADLADEVATPQDPAFPYDIFAVIQGPGPQQYWWGYDEGANTWTVRGYALTGGQAREHHVESNGRDLGVIDVGPLALIRSSDAACNSWTTTPATGVGNTGLGLVYRLAYNSWWGITNDAAGPPGVYTSSNGYDWVFYTELVIAGLRPSKAVGKPGNLWWVMLRSGPNRHEFYRESVLKYTITITGQRTMTNHVGAANGADYTLIFQTSTTGIAELYKLTNTTGTLVGPAATAVAGAWVNAYSPDGVHWIAEHYANTGGVTTYWRSSDSADTWTQITSYPTGFLFWKPDFSKIYLFKSISAILHEVWESTDWGATWVKNIANLVPPAGYGSNITAVMYRGQLGVPTS